MGKFFQNIALFSLPFWALLAWLLLADQAPAYSYNMLQKDCRTGNWIYRRLYESKVPIDIAFLGTSKTMCDVNDSLVEAKVLLRHQKSFHIVNLGICRIGANLHYLLARDLMQHKAPRYIVYEVGTELATSSHPSFTHLATAQDVFASPFLTNSNYVADLVQFTWNKLVYEREDMLGIKRSFDDFLHDSLHSFMGVINEVVADSAMMARQKEKRIREANAEPDAGLIAWIDQLRSQYPKHYLLGLKALCEAQGSQLIFLYLPSYGIPNKEPSEAAFLRELGPIWIPPDSAFSDPKLHFDQNHLNGRGATRLSDWLADRLGDLEAI
jgi:hypothetical protein